MADIKDIWNDGEGKLPEDKLMAYLEGRLSPEEQHEVETWLAAEGMEADALEGLKTLPAAETQQLVNHLNHNLHTKLKSKKRHRKQIADNQWAWLAVVIILLLAIVGYMVLRVANKKDEVTTPKAIEIAEPDTVTLDGYDYKLIKFKPKVSFDDFKVDQLYTGSPISLDFNSNKNARRFRSQIRHDYEKGLNFAGHYCFIEWGCGSPCQSSVLVDLETGKIYDGLPASLGYEYYRNSRMIIVNPVSDEPEFYPEKKGYYADCAYCLPEIWVWNDESKKFEQVQ